MSLVGIGAGAFLSALTVDPDVMVAKANAVQGRIREMQASFSALENTVNKTKNYWIGEAGDAHREFYTKQKSNIDEIFKRLTEDVSDLHQMAAVYSSTEQQVADIAEDLPSDVIC